LTSTSVGQTKAKYTYDAHGNMTTMSHLPMMALDFKDHLQATQTRVANDGPVETTYYVYDAAGQRIRKVNQTAGGSISNERIYLGGFEVYREYDGSGTTKLERQTLHVMDDKQRVALVESLTLGKDGSPLQLIRYQFANHLGSACLELEEAARIVSYEEYYPYGSTSYQAVDKSVKAAAKRYRYTGKERDEETGLSYHGARNYAPWLGRWTSCDPSGLGGGTSLYCYVNNNPLKSTDPTGLQADDPNANSTTPIKQDQIDGGVSNTPMGGKVIEYDSAKIDQETQKAIENVEGYISGTADDLTQAAAEGMVNLEKGAYNAAVDLLKSHISVDRRVHRGPEAQAAVKMGQDALESLKATPPNGASSIPYMFGYALPTLALNLPGESEAPLLAGTAQTGKIVGSAGLQLDVMDAFTKEFIDSEGQILNQQAAAMRSYIHSEIGGNPRLMVGVSTTFVEGEQISLVKVSDPKVWDALKSGESTWTRELALGERPVVGPNGQLPPSEHVEIAGPREMSQRYGAQGVITGTAGPACERFCAPRWWSGDFPSVWHTKVPPRNY
jgi:RHS repeat-associated protein